MIVIGGYSLIISFMVFLIIVGVRKNNKSYSSGENYIFGGVFGASMAVFLWTVIGFLGIGGSLEPNQINNHTAKLDSLVEQAGGTGGNEYVRVDYVNSSTPAQVVTFASGDTLYRVDGTQTVIRTVDNVKDARVVRQEYFSHYPLLVPMYSADEFRDRYVIYVPKTAIVYGTTNKPVTASDE